MKQNNRSIFWAMALLPAFLSLSCDDDDNNNNLGTTCESAAECYPDVNPDEIIGQVVCLDSVAGGYCTHHCGEDTDCCAAAGECPNAAEHPVLCAPFESMSGKYCFLSCEGVEDEETYCATYAHEDFVCRSTGGGTENKKVCVP